MKFNIYTVIYILITLLAMYGCDTADNISPRNTETFIRLFGGEFKDEGVGITALEDNRIAILASTTETAVVTGQEPNKDIVIILTDSSGTEAEVYTIGNSGVDETPSGMVYYNGDLYVGGTTNINGDNDFLYLRFSLGSASVTDYRSIGQRDTSEACFDIALAENTSVSTAPLVVLAGEIGINDTTQSFDTWISLDGDSVGSLIPSARYDGRTKSIVPFDRNYYLSLGEDQSLGLNTQNIKLSRVQYTNGVTGDSKDITPSDGFYNATRLLLVNQNIVLTNGYRSTLGQINDSDGVVFSENQTSPNFPGNGDKNFVFLESLQMVTTDIIRANDGGYLLLGTDSEGKIIRLVKLNFNLDTIEWSEEYGTTGELDKSGSICQFPDGKIFFTASVSFQIGGTNTKIALYKTDVNGQLDP
jgi:hypothetical protein